ncbi:MAG: carboxypeptidase-like regulatory domain-containing protein, partial [Bacteroidota bacterium]
MLYKLQLFIALFLFSPWVHAQYLLNGTVSDENNEPLPGVSIAVKGTSAGTSTDANGRFVLRIKDNQPVVLVCSYVGYATREAAADKTTGELNIVLAASLRQVELVVFSAGTYRLEVIGGA